VFGVEFCPSHELSLVHRLDPLFLVPPGSVAVEIGSNVRRTDNGHTAEYSTNFLIFISFAQSRGSPCEIFPTSPAIIFLERKSSMRIIQV
jgi:hypothetical protein